MVIKMSKRWIGLTGPSGSGKSYVANLFSKYGIPSIDTDKLVHKLYLPNTLCQKELLESFGEKIISENGPVDRKKLASIVFSDPQKLNLLNRIVHKYVFQEIQNQVEQLPDSIKNVLIDAPQLFESGIDQKCAFTIAVLADYNTRLSRISVRDKISNEAIQSRFCNQHTDDFFIQNCDFVIYNNPNDSLEKQIKEIVNKIL
jgi:dephospho-CoA kinase